MRASGRGSAWIDFGFTLYAGLTMVTNVPFYSFKDVSFEALGAVHRRSSPIALGIAVINIHPPAVLFALFVRLRHVGLRASMSGKKPRASR